MSHKFVEGNHKLSEVTGHQGIECNCFKRSMLGTTMNSEIPSYSLIMSLLLGTCNFMSSWCGDRLQKNILNF